MLLPLDLVRLGFEPALDLVLQGARGGVARVRALRERLQTRPLESDGDLPPGRALPRRPGRVAEDRGERGDRVRARERPLEREDLVHHDPERPDVRALVDVAGGRLFGRHVGGSTEDLADARVVLARRQHAPHVDAVEDLREAPVEDLHFAVLAEHHVRGLEVAVEDPPAVGEVDRLRDLQEDLDEAGDREVRHRLRVAAAERAEDVGERAPADVAHRAERRAALGDEDVERHDVRVLELPEDPRLVEEARASDGIVSLHDLEGDVAAERGVAREEDGAHAALGEEARDLVAHAAGLLLRRRARARRLEAAARRRRERDVFGGIGLRVLPVVGHAASTGLGPKRPTRNAAGTGSQRMSA